MGVETGKQSVLYKTVDQGKTWQLLFENPDEEGFFDSIAFFDDKNGLLLGDPVDGYYVVMTTQDGGANWQRIAKSSIPKMLEKEAAFAASGNTLIVGANTNAWFTTVALRHQFTIALMADCTGSALLFLYIIKLKLQAAMV